MIILHGLLGSSDNWLTQARHFEGRYKVYLPDQRNHGRSPHSNVFNYESMADDLNVFMHAHHIHQPVLVGHSMGGKTVMRYALDHPDAVRALVVVDIGPKAYPVQHQPIVDAMKNLPLEGLSSRNQADTELARHIPEEGVRQFVLKNLVRTETLGFAWRPNLTVLDTNLARVGDAITSRGTYDGPALFLHGRRSGYVKEEDGPGIKRLFPHASFAALDTGHWVQAEKPQEFSGVLEGFLPAIP